MTRLEFVLPTSRRNVLRLEPFDAREGAVSQHSIAEFLIRQASSSWQLAVDDCVYDFHSKEDALTAAMEVAHDLDVPSDIFVVTDSGDQELLWSSDPVKLLRDLFRVWRADGRGLS